MGSRAGGQAFGPSSVPRASEVRGAEKVVTELGDPDNKGRERGWAGWGGLATVSGFPGLDDGNKGFHYTILSTFVHVQHSLSKN